MLRQAKVTDIYAIYPLINIIWEDMDFPLKRLLPDKIFQDTMLNLMALPHSKFSYTNCWVNEEETHHISGILYSYAGVREAELDEQFFSYIDTHFPELNIRQYADNREAHDDEWYLDSLVVDYHYRGRGIAKMFFKHLPLVTNATLIGLNCDVHNPKAKLLYEQLGFKTTEMMMFLGHEYYHMQKDISDAML
ncbi:MULTISPECIES: N-acetyltransferase [unclassified Granulicatella]|uniref:GNAT family N-acetyltransferase n=1 Tax=unclassified Granulicatella TaxID=2630493 RepID=UPI0010733E78|nr:MULTISPECIES: GNAT family N-acetyltransferase [unclassified Granulicatella]MBF0780700.1 GNAT family N-acetyltransferase [Granulicatella sp. 19428wC4_WM01]TFU94219.1 N-acetyltransferase [Granulicatella sp. WM01]